MKKVEELTILVAYNQRTSGQEAVQVHPRDVTCSWCSMSPRTDDTMSEGHHCVRHEDTDDGCGETLDERFRELNEGFRTRLENLE